MILRLDPRLPLIWRTPWSLQVGVGRRAAILDHVSPLREKLVAALVSGVTESGLEVITATTPESERDVVFYKGAFAEPRTTLALLEGALERPRPSVVGRAVTIVGTGHTASLLAEMLSNRGIRVVPDGVETEFGIVVAPFVVPPAFHGLWLSRDIPHLAIVLADGVSRVGPIVEPGDGPCLYCLERHHADADVAWPAMASQLLGRDWADDDRVASAEVAALAARIVVARLAGGFSLSGARHESTDLDAETGEQTVTAWARHPECGCDDLGAAAPLEVLSSSRARRGNGMHGGLHRVPDLRPPTTGAADDGPA